MQHSVIRRSLYIGLFFVAGHAFYYLLVLAANAKLDPVGFGRFYLGWATLNILVAPGAVLTLALSRHFAGIFQQNGATAVGPALRSVAARVLPWALAVVAATEVLLLFGGNAVGADSSVMIVLLPLTALTSVMVDTARAVFQGALRFVWFGASWLTWCFGQFVFGAAALLLIGAPWAVFLGMLAANCVMLLCLVAVVWRMSVEAASQELSSPPQQDFAVQSLRHMLPFCTALGAFVVLSNADVLVAYLKLTGAELGIYAASAVLPKAIVTATQPVVQVILPVATNFRGDSLRIREALLKAIGTTFALATLGAIALWLVSGEACGGNFGIKFCDPALLLVLASAAVAASVIRTAIIADVLGGRHWRPLLSIPALAVFAAATGGARSSGMGLATSYSIVCWLLLCIMVAAKLVEWHRGGGGPSFKRGLKG
jgi:O-antigen/teichoic acid export membrane protein